MFTMRRKGSFEDESYALGRKQVSLKRGPQDP